MLADNLVSISTDSLQAYSLLLGGNIESARYSEDLRGTREDVYTMSRIEATGMSM